MSQGGGRASDDSFGDGRWVAHPRALKVAPSLKTERHARTRDTDTDEDGTRCGTDSGSGMQRCGEERDKERETQRERQRERDKERERDLMQNVLRVRASN